MALREVRTLGDPILEKVCKPVKIMTPRLSELIDDMFDTMYEHNGVGLAAPQVGVLRRIVVIDVSDAYAEDEEDNGEAKKERPAGAGYEGPIVLINPELVESDGSQTGGEGCLSVPDKVAMVTRPEHVIVKALDENMKPFEIEGEGLLARALCHEIDHLEGHMYVEIAESPLQDAEEFYREQEEQKKASGGGSD